MNGVSTAEFIGAVLVVAVVLAFVSRWLGIKMREWENDKYGF